MTITAIETRYAGHRFRSRLEARWAVFFDALDMKWEYEPQGFVINGQPYLPDFLVYPGTDHAFWFEVKGRYPEDADLQKVEGLATETGITAYLHFGGINAPSACLDNNTPLEELMCEDIQLRWAWDNREGWQPAGFERVYTPPEWQRLESPTAFRFGPSYLQTKPPRTGFWWWTECGLCERVHLKLHGWVGDCPVAGRFPDHQYGHLTRRVLGAFEAARSARFEHGEYGAHAAHNNAPRH